MTRTQRATTDLVVLMFAGTVVFVVVVVTVGMLFARWLWPNTDLTSWEGVVHQLLIAMLGGVAGFVFGKKVGNGVKE